MTRKDYQLIADAIKLTNQDNDSDDLRALALNLCVELKKQNPAFKKELFIKACGL
tara:strand:- start:323 stop:487 length:165 start_codon:yes stop_codon:yes gene_type:complete